MPMRREQDNIKKCLKEMRLGGWTGRMWLRTWKSGGLLGVIVMKTGVPENVGGFS